MDKLLFQTKSDALAPLTHSVTPSKTMLDGAQKKEDMPVLTYPPM